VLPIGHGWNLAIVSLGLAIGFVALLMWSGFSVALQINQLIHTLNQQLQSLEQEMAAFGLAPAAAKDGSASISDVVRFLFPNPNQLFGEAQSAFGQTIGGVGDAIIIVLIGAFVAADPVTYRRNFVELLPLRQRRRVSIVLDESAKLMRRWLIGQFAAMLLLAVLTWLMLAAMRVPSAALLGILAGLLEFIPYLGAILGAGPILLVALPLGTTTLLITLGLYALIHLVVGNIISPLIQKRTVHLAPATALASLTLFGVLFGIASVAVANPVVIAVRHAIIRLRELPADAAPEAANP